MNKVPVHAIAEEYQYFLWNVFKVSDMSAENAVKRVLLDINADERLCIAGASDKRTDVLYVLLSLSVERHNSKWFEWFLHLSNIDVNVRLDSNYANPLRICLLPVYEDKESYIRQAHILHYLYGASVHCALKEDELDFTSQRWWNAEERAKAACVALLALRRKKRSALVTRNVAVALWEACVVRQVWETRTDPVWEVNEFLKKNLY